MDNMNMADDKSCPRSGEQTRDRLSVRRVDRVSFERLLPAVVPVAAALFLFVLMDTSCAGNSSAGSAEKTKRESRAVAAARLTAL